jgi:hypothetical protein
MEIGQVHSDGSQQLPDLFIFGFLGGLGFKLSRTVFRLIPCIPYTSLGLL